jgi:hypothetical protein
MIGKLLGHTQPATTARYAHLAADPMRAASDLVGGKITTLMMPPVPTSAQSEKGPTPAFRTVK